MDKVAQLLRSAEPPQIVGCWGYGDDSTLEVLSALLDATCPPILDVALLDVRLSASRFFTDREQADAWATVAEERLILGRDAFGRVPLYWTQVEQVIWFASRSQVLLPLLQERSISIEALYGYSCFSYVPTPLTPVQGIGAIAAGTEMSWTRDEQTMCISSPQSSRSFEWREADTLLVDESDAIAQLQTLLKDAIDRETSDLGDEPVGVLLSGGLDSSIVAALLVQAGVKVRAYSLDFGGAGASEYLYAEQVARSLNIPLVKVDASPQRIRNALISTVQALDLPFGDGVTVPLFLLSEAASRDTRVIFNGEGGDQLFAGWTNKPVIAASVYQTHHPTEEESFTHQYLHTFHRLWGYEALVYDPMAYARVKDLQAQDWLQDAIDPAFTTSLLSRLRRASLMLKGAQNIHPRATALGWAHGLKVRSLFCDMPLAQWTFGLSGALCLHGSCEKYILKRAVEGWLPPEVVWRQKRGMGVPLTAWCFNEWWHDLGDWLNPNRLRAEQLWQPDLAAHVVEGKLGAAIAGRRMGEVLWMLIMWEMWMANALHQPCDRSAHRLSWNHPFWLPPWVWKYRQKWKE
ncbi:MAG: asparagine synthase [Myxacorys chilensis ATA2-1-KO14]|nr:asparagine synthase [Myxacorys chilensis ATA2-1-KO14]